ncbi:MAG: adenylate/guanylate cyclase domain-containing protein [Cyanobacteria bacterium P01_F01_bin.4]
MNRQWKHWFWQWRGVAIATPTVALVVLLLRAAGLMQALEWRAYDQFLRWRPAQTDARIAIVGIDETDISTLNQSILPDAVYAEVIQTLSAQQPRAIGLDIYRDVPVEPGHAELVEVFRNTPNLVGIRKLVGEAGRDTVAASPVLAELGQIGINDLLADTDNTVRRGMLQATSPEGDSLPSFALYLALLYLEAEGIGPEMVGDTDMWRLGTTTFRPFEANDGAYVRANAEGYQTLINYRGGAQLFETVPLRTVLNDQLPPDWGRDRIILIGPVSESFKDIYFTPYSTDLLGIPEQMAGVEIHANLTSQIISAALDGRPLIRSWPELLEILWIIGWTALGAILTWVQRDTTSGFRFQRVAALCLAALSLVAVTHALLVLGWWVPVVPPLIALSGASIGVIAYLAHGANQIRRTFGRYLSDQVVANLLEYPEKLKLGGENRVITLLTSDIRGFTSLSERLRPEQVVEVLNLYLGFMSDVINRYGGTIDEFMGDGILVLFGAPNLQPDAPDRAVACAIAMQQVMPQVNQVMRDRNFPELEMGIGINTGEVVVGNIGSEKRTKYSVIGSAVNLAYRIESYTTGGQILISDHTLQQVVSPVQVQDQQTVHPKGVKLPLTIHDVIGIGGPYNLTLAAAKMQMVTLTEPIAVAYAVLDGKQVSDETIQGMLVKLSDKGAWLKPLVADNALTKLTNLRLSVQSPDAPDEVTQADIYAKVQSTVESDHCQIVFTARSQPVVDWMKSLLAI